MMQKRKCAKCGKMFQPTNSQSKYCSVKCKVAAKNNNKKHTKKVKAEPIPLKKGESFKTPDGKKFVMTGKNTAKEVKKTEPKKVKVVSHEKIKLPAVKAKKPVAKKEAKPSLPKMPKGCDTMITIHNPNGNHKKVVGLLLAALHKEIIALAK